MIIIPGIGIGPGKRKPLDYVNELANLVLSLLMGQSFTKESAEVSAKAINFLHGLKKDVEQDLRGKCRNIAMLPVYCTY